MCSFPSEQSRYPLVYLRIRTQFLSYIYALYFLIKQIFHLELLMSVCPHSIRLTLGVDGNGDGEWWVSPISAAHRGRPLTPAQ